MKSPAQTAGTTLTPTPTPTPAPLTFVATGSMHTARIGATAVLLPNGKVLIAGGWQYPAGMLGGDYYDYFSSAELYDPATGKFTPTGSMTTARAGAAATVLPDGRVLIVGGTGCVAGKSCTDADGRGISFLASAELYDPATGRFTSTGSMNAHDSGDQVATLLPDGRVLLVGYGNAAELYDPSSGRFLRTGGETPMDAATVTSTLLPNGKVLVTGESADDTHPTVAQLYDVASGTFTTVSLALPAGTPPATYEGKAIERGAPEWAVLLTDGRVLLYENGYLETYDPDTGACADAGFISRAGEWFPSTVTLMANDRVLFAGGTIADPVSGLPLATRSAVLYDASGGPLRTGSMTSFTEGTTATLLPDGSVLIAGGEDADGNALASAELFVP